MSFLENLNWRQAVKNFDPSKEVLKEDLDKILEAIRLAPTSYGMQPFHVTVIGNNELKKELRQYSYNQSQIENASHVLVFSNYDVLKRSDEFVGLLTGQGVSQQKIDSIKSALLNYGKMSEEARKAWADKQLAIALGFALAALSELKIDSCPIEGFIPSEYKRVLGLSEYLNPSVVLPIGYRAVEEYQRPKTRFSKEDLFDFRD